MKNVLLITSSPRGEASYSTQVATEFAREIPNATLTVRELWRNPISHVDPSYVHAAFTPEANRSVEQRETLALSDKLIAELKAADIVVIAAGMINFGMPSTLKSWLDRIARAGLTFSYSEAGVEGLVTGKKTFLILATGGIYSVGPMAAMNHLEPPLRSILGFLGMTDMETILIEGVNMGPEITEKALADARAKATAVAAGLAG